MGDKKEAPPEGLVVSQWVIRRMLGTNYEIWVRLFEAGTATEIGQSSITISATTHVDALRKAIIGKDFSKLEGRKFDELVVKPTRDGAPLNLNTDLWEVEFERDNDGKLQAYVDVPPKPAAGEDLTLVQISKVVQAANENLTML